MPTHVRVTEITSRVANLLAAQRDKDDGTCIVISYDNTDMLHYEYFDSPAECTTVFEQLATLLVFSCTRPFIRSKNVLFQPARVTTMMQFVRGGLYFIGVIFAEKKNLSFGFRTEAERDGFEREILGCLEVDDNPTKGE